MELLKAILILVIGFVLLIKGADFFVEGSSSVAKKFHVPAMLIGMTIVAMGTSLANNNSLAVSNVIGSNIFNLMVVCGACALFSPLTIRQDTLKKEFPLSIICAALMLVLGYIGMTLGHIDGIIFLVLFVGYLLWMIQSAKKARAAVLSDPGQSGQIEQAEFVEENIAILPTWKSLIFIIGGMIAIKFGGDFVVDGASSIASSMGLSQTLIGLTIVAMGTSLPELVTSLVAAKKGEVDMALGNVIGSDIFNILFVLGIATVISPISFLMENVIDIILLIIMSLIVLAFAWTRQQINRKEGILMLLMYAAYMVYICVR